MMDSMAIRLSVDVFDAAKAAGAGAMTRRSMVLLQRK
jgi:hypothetical protein